LNPNYLNSNSILGSSSSSGNGHGGPEKKKMVSQACERCRIKKRRCDGKFPYCSNCEKASRKSIINRGVPILCIYEPITKKRGPKKGYKLALRRHQNETQNQNQNQKLESDKFDPHTVKDKVSGIELPSDTFNNMNGHSSSPSSLSENNTLSSQTVPPVDSNAPLILKGLNKSSISSIPMSYETSFANFTNSEVYPFPISTTIQYETLGFPIVSQPNPCNPEFTSSSSLNSNTSSFCTTDPFIPSPSIAPAADCPFSILMNSSSMDLSNGSFKNYHGQVTNETVPLENETMDLTIFPNKYASLCKDTLSLYLSFSLSNLSPLLI